jgi:hypothetical protein
MIFLFLLLNKSIMTLENIYTEAYRKKKEEIFERYNKKKVVATKGKLPVFQKKFQDRLNIEYAELFSQNIDINSEYLFIEKLSHKIPGEEDSYKTFDEEYYDAKNILLQIFQDAVNKPKVAVLFSKGDEPVVRKLGDLKAYDDLRGSFEQALKDYEKKNKQHEVVDLKDDFEVIKKFRSLFIDDKLRKLAQETFNDYYYDVNGKFIKIDGYIWQTSNFFALYDVWLDYNYLKVNLNRNKSVETICLFFSFQIPKRIRLASKSDRYKNAKKNFMQTFNKILPPK